MTDYLNVEVSSQKGNSQVKANGATGHKNIIHMMRTVPIREVLHVRLEMLKLLRMIDDTLTDDYKSD